MDGQTVAHDLPYYAFDLATTDGKVGNWSTNPTDAIEEWDCFAWYLK